MLPGNRKIELTQRDDYSHTITFVTTAGAAINYSTSTWEAWIGVPGIHIESLTIDSSSSSTGIIVVSLTNPQTLRLPRLSHWELRMTVAGITSTMLAGEAVVERKVGP